MPRNCVLETSPPWVACTAPSLNSSRVGAERTWQASAVLGLVSISTFTTLTRPAYSSASSSSIGAIALHGAHHVAQKSTSTGVSEARTSVSKLQSVMLHRLSIMRLFSSAVRESANQNRKQSWLVVM